MSVGHKGCQSNFAAICAMSRWGIPAAFPRRISDSMQDNIPPILIIAHTVSALLQNSRWIGFDSFMWMSWLPGVCRNKKITHFHCEKKRLVKGETFRFLFPKWDVHSYFQWKPATVSYCDWLICSFTVHPHSRKGKEAQSRNRKPELLLFPRG